VRLFPNILLFTAAMLILIPLLYVFNTAVKTPAEFLRDSISIVRVPTLDNFVEAWQRAKLGLHLLNSIFYVIASVVGICVVSLLAAYPISRGHFKHSNALYVFFLSGLFLPGSLVPVLFLMKFLGLMNTIPGYLLIKIAGSLSFSIIVLSGFIRSIPTELDDAAEIDGCGYFRFIFTILARLMSPALATIAILAGIGIWNDFIDPLLFLYSQRLRPATTALYVFFGQFSVEWTIVTAALLIISVPIIISFVFFQRYIIEGAISGALKG
jgi:raffinose/stachyose/melibiose transport system permease protein